MRIGSQQLHLSGRLFGLLAIPLTSCTPTGGGGTPRNASNNNATPAAQWQLLFENLPADLLSITGSSPTDVYTCGTDPGDGMGPFVLHFDGQSWRRLATGQNGDLWWISDPPIGGALYLAGEGGTILRFDPVAGTFERQTTPGNETLFGIWGSAPDQIWAVGGFPGRTGTGVIWRFDGQIWQVEDLSAIDPAGIPTAFKVWGRSASDVYVVGEFGLMLHFDGTTWTRLDNPPNQGQTLLTVHGNATQVAAVGGVNTGVILEQAGSTFVNRAPAGILGVNGVFIPSSSQGVAAGREGLVLFRSDSGWTPQSTGFRTVQDFHATWVAPNGDVWAVGGNVINDTLNAGILARFGPGTIATQIGP